MKIKDTNAQYHENNALSRSDLRYILKSPLHFKCKMNEPKVQTKEMLFGSAFHKLILEPDNFDNEYAIMQSVDGRSKEGKAYKEQFMLEAGDKNIIDELDYASMLQMRASLFSNDLAKALLTNGEVETSFYWKDEATGIDLKCRPDVVKTIGQNKLIIDLKTCKDASKDEFQRSCISYFYTLQAAMCREGLRVETGEHYEFIFIAIEKDSPYDINIYQADDLFFKKGYKDLQNCLNIYKQCCETDNWYGYMGLENNINILSLPDYIARKFKED